jgi:hypothetical protein
VESEEVTDQQQLMNVMDYTVENEINDPYTSLPVTEYIPEEYQ